MLFECCRHLRSSGECACFARALYNGFYIEHISVWNCSYSFETVFLAVFAFRLLVSNHVEYIIVGWFSFPTSYACISSWHELHAAAFICKHHFKRVTHKQKRPYKMLSLKNLNKFFCVLINERTKRKKCVHTRGYINHTPIKFCV